MAGSGHRGQGLVRPLDGPGREAELLGRLDEAQEVGADAVGAGQLAHPLHGDGQAVVQGDRRQGGGPAVALVTGMAPCPGATTSR